MERQVNSGENTRGRSVSSTSFPSLPDIGTDDQLTYGTAGNAMAHNGRLRPQRKTWTVPSLPKLHTTGQRTNAIDERTIYSQQQQQLYRVLSQEKDVPCPLQCSPRVATFGPDAHQLREKSLVMRDFFSTGPVRRYERDRAAIPSVYAEFFECPKRRKNYVRQMYSDDFQQRNSSQPTCDKRRYGRGPKHPCHFCDVMGKKYCSFCTEFKNRNFALSYEQNYLPRIALHMPDFQQTSQVNLRAHKPKTRV